MSRWEDYDPLECTICNCKFADKRILQRHYLTDKHKRNCKEGGSYKCEFCNSCFTTAKLCNNHSRNCNAKYNKNNNKLVKYMEEIKILKEQNKRLTDDLQFTKDRLMKTEYLLEKMIIKSIPNEPQNIVITNNNASESDESKKINITKKNFEKKLPELITEPKCLKDVERAWQLKLQTLKISGTECNDGLTKKFYDLFSKFLENYDKEDMFCYVPTKKNNPSTIYYYDDDSWNMADCEILFNTFINTYSKKCMCGLIESSKNGLDKDTYVQQTEIFMKFEEKVNTCNFYKTLYHKLI